MNIKSSLVVLSVTAILVSAANVRAQVSTPNIQSFEQWCQQKDTLPEETKRTVEILLRQTRTQDCKAANLRLNSLKELSLNTSPRTGFFISDVQPLASLTNLTFLSLYGNGISDVQPLANLTNLTVLYLDGNQISDVQPLASLTNLMFLDLRENATLTNKICPVRRESICSF